MMLNLLSAATMALALQVQADPPRDAASEAPEVEATVEQTEADRRNERVCERRPVTGSGIARRVCYTRAEMEARAEADRHRLESMQGAVTVGQPDGFAPPQ
ncbi:MAG: hypothetical protein ACK4FB_01865 [Brevundimonas sp.]|uniref:hypothetical protein n=1 Tax=Brevundimonas sp. TaxID=1871086 RepID=UPI00391BCD48